MICIEKTRCRMIHGFRIKQFHLMRRRSTASLGAGAIIVNNLYSVDAHMLRSTAHVQCLRLRFIHRIFSHTFCIWEVIHSFIVIIVLQVLHLHTEIAFAEVLVLSLLMLVWAMIIAFKKVMSIGNILWRLEDHVVILTLLHEIWRSFIMTISAFLCNLENSIQQIIRGSSCSLPSVIEPLIRGDKGVVTLIWACGLPLFVLFRIYWLSPHMPVICQYVTFFTAFLSVKALRTLSLALKSRTSLWSTFSPPRCLE